MIDPGILVVAGIAAYALWSGTSGTEGPGTQATLGPGGGPTTRAAPGAQPGSGGGGAGPAGVALAAPITKIGQDLFRRATGQAPTIPPRTDAATGLVPVTAETLPTMYLDVPLHLYTGAEISALATQAGTTPAHLLDAAASMGASPADAAAVMQGAASAAESGVTGTAAIGTQAVAYVGWAIPIAMAVAIGAMILRSALSRRGSFGESKDRARASVARLGMPQAYQIANTVLDSLIATNRVPEAFTRDVALQTGYVFAIWFENVDSFYDVFQGTPGGLELHDRLLAKARIYYDRVDAVALWRRDVLRFVQQGDQSWGAQTPPQAYIEEIGRQVPPPAWLRAWRDFQEFAALGYAGMLQYLREQVAYETVGRWAGEGGNA